MMIQKYRNMGPLRYLINFWKTLEMPLVNCEISLILTSSENCKLIYGSIDDQVPNFAITGTKFYVPIVTLSTQKNVKTIRSIKRTINWNKYQ